MKQLYSDFETLESFSEYCILNDIQDLSKKTKYFKRYKSLSDLFLLSNLKIQFILGNLT